MTLRWRAYYGDGSTFDARDGHAFDAPARNVQMIAVSDPEHGWYLCRSEDYYWWLPIPRRASYDDRLRAINDALTRQSLSDSQLLAIESALGLCREQWQCGDKFGLFDDLIELGPKRVLFGRTIGNDSFRAIFERAMNDPEIPQKTGWQPQERRSAGITA